MPSKYVEIRRTEKYLYDSQEDPHINNLNYIETIFQTVYLK